MQVIVIPSGQTKANVVVQAVIEFEGTLMFIVRD